MITSQETVDLGHFLRQAISLLCKCEIGVCASTLHNEYRLILSLVLCWSYFWSSIHDKEYPVASQECPALMAYALYICRFLEQSAFCSPYLLNLHLCLVY